MQQEVVTVGVDLANNVFQVHAIDADGKVLVRRQLRRAEVVKFFAALPPCMVGMEACASAHHWGRELLVLGHDVRLMPPAYVKPYVKRGKTDAADAEAICEAVTRPTMRFVAVKNVDQQPALPHPVRGRRLHAGMPGAGGRHVTVGHAGRVRIDAADRAARQTAYGGQR